MTVRADSPALHALIAADACFEQVATGLHFAEGPIWSRPGGFLLFTDIPASTIWQLDATGTSVWRSDTNMANGLALDREGRVVACEAATSVLSRFEHDGSRTVLATAWQGRELNSPNDVVVAPDGSIFCTDPWYGRMPVYGVERERELDVCGVFRIALGGELQLVADDFGMPNGLCCSPDGALLYVNDTERAHIRAFAVRADGSIGAGRLFAEGIGTGSFETGLVDGMKCDEHGNLWATSYSGIWVVAPDGEVLGVVRTPEFVANIAFGGAGWDELYLTATHGLYRLRTRTRSARVPHVVHAQLQGIAEGLRARLDALRVTIRLDDTPGGAAQAM